MKKENKYSTWTELFEEKVKEQGIVFQSNGGQPAREAGRTILGAL